MIPENVKEYYESRLDSLGRVSANKNPIIPDYVKEYMDSLNLNSFS